MVAIFKHQTLDCTLLSGEGLGAHRDSPVRWPRLFSSVLVHSVHLVICFEVEKIKRLGSHLLDINPGYRTSGCGSGLPPSAPAQGKALPVFPKASR